MLGKSKPPVRLKYSSPGDTWGLQVCISSSLGLDFLLSIILSEGRVLPSYSTVKNMTRYDYGMSSQVFTVKSQTVRCVKFFEERGGGKYFSLRCLEAFQLHGVERGQISCCGSQKAWGVCLRCRTRQVTPQALDSSPFTNERNSVVLNTQGC